MKADRELSNAEIRVMRKYDKLHSAMLEFVEAMQYMDEGDVVLEDIIVNHKPAGGIRLEYKSRPVQITINTASKQFILKALNK